MLHTTSVQACRDTVIPIPNQETSMCAQCALADTLMKLSHRSARASHAALILALNQIFPQTAPCDHGQGL